MLINFPNQLTSEEEQLLKKIAKMKKKVIWYFFEISADVSYFRIVKSSLVLRVREYSLLQFSMIIILKNLEKVVYRKKVRQRVTS